MTRTSILSLALALAIVPAVSACSHDAPQRTESTTASSAGGTTMASRDDDRPAITTRDTDHDGTRDTVAVRGEGAATVRTRDTERDGTDDTMDAHAASAPTTARASQTTALDQSESSQDVDITGRIRQAVVADSSLSLGARNCVIVTQHGHVTLRGDVTRAERDAIVTHAEHVAGVTNVDNELHVTDVRASR